MELIYIDYLIFLVLYLETHYLQLVASTVHGQVYVTCTMPLSVEMLLLYKQ
jgi:hypothetical protein